jgi:hypothetical protein
MAMIERPPDYGPSPAASASNAPIGFREPATAARAGHAPIGDKSLIHPAVVADRPTHPAPAAPDA